MWNYLSIKEKIKGGKSAFHPHKKGESAEKI